RYQTEDDKSQDSSDGWQEASSKKRKFLNTQEGQKRTVGRPRKLGQPEANQAKLAEKIFFPQTQTQAQQPTNILTTKVSTQNFNFGQDQQSQPSTQTQPEERAGHTQDTEEQEMDTTPPQ
ncbi:hypothetical protein LTR22_028332, partial [Elasticomyces elasticus]